jgi:site-specific DNA-methyltransferase (adenine-specific)
MNRIYFGDNLPILKAMPNESVDLIYIDPPFNTGKTQKHTTIRTIKSENGDRKGFQGNTYQTVELGTIAYKDTFDAYIEGFLRPRLNEAYRLLKSNGCLYFHIDYREVHYCKILLDGIFGRDNFINEIIWAYDFGAKAKTKWPTKHDNILFYVKDSSNYIFNTFAIDREEYMAPGLVGPEKAERGKLPTDTWWHTIVGTNSRERTGYPTQKPLGVINRIIQASSYQGSIVLDFFAGSGTIGESCLKLDREFILIDNNPVALEVMARRFAGNKNIEWIGFDPSPYQENIPDTRVKLQEQANADFDFITSTARYFRSEIEEISDQWQDSPLGWMYKLAPGKKGSLAKKIITVWCASKGLDVQHTSVKDIDLFINGLRFVVKLSFLWENGAYKFQQIKDNGYDNLICLGISPFDAHCWVFERTYVIKNATPQHKSSMSTDYWIAINPNKTEEWANNFGGTLGQAYQILKNVKKK